MKSNERLDTLRHIKLGVNEVFYYDYDGNALPVRPISSYELDDCFYKALKYATSEVADLVLKIRLKLIDRADEIDFSNEDYLSLQHHYDTISYWVVFHSMKDFQDEDFSIPIYKNTELLPKGIFLIRKMNYVHDIANYILDSCYKPKDFIKQIIKDEIGREIAYLVFYFNTPLSNISDITKLQRDYLIYSKGKIIKVRTSDIKTKQYEFSGEKLTIADLCKRVGMVIPDG